MSQSNPEVTPESLRARVADSFPADLGVEPLEVTDERSTGRIVVDRRHLHPGGLVHGGAWVALADSVAAWQTFRHLPPGHNFTTVEMKLNVFAAGRPGRRADRHRRAPPCRAHAPTWSRSASIAPSAWWRTCSSPSS